MARRSQGFALKLHQKGIWYVRFTHQGRRTDVSTGARDHAQAVEAAQGIYAETISGKRRAPPVHQSGGSGIIEVGTRWLAAVSTELDPLTVEQYLMYTRAHFAPFFGTIGAVTTTSAESYIRKRLGAVQRDTVLKELSGLRGLVGWAAGEGYISEIPHIPSPQKKATGEVVYERKVTELSPVQVARFLRAVGDRHLAREYFGLMYETTLRPATLQALSVPEHFRQGAKMLTIEDAIDKARFGRELPLTAKARQLLKAASPKAGLIFGQHDYRTQLANACARAKLPLFTPYDLRHARATHLLETSGNLPGVAYLLGHRNTATTSARYVHPSLRAARDVLGRRK